jgi:Pyruvate phosphate dikinase, AMP/ATP-binding domain
MKLGERAGALDIVLYDALPNEMPRVAGVITTVMQTPLSHVNLRAVQDRVPNAVITNALTNAAVTKFVGRYVRFEVNETGYKLGSATQAEVESHHTNARPKTGQIPQRDLSIKTITPLSQISFKQWTTFGVKTANVATLRTFDLPKVVVPDGFGIPFWFYDDFMRSNGLYGVAKTMMTKGSFRSNPDVQDTQLQAFRKMIRAAPMPTELAQALQKVRSQFPESMAIRCRSSTNNEDLPGFSGAGLYDSRTQRPDEGPLDKCVKQVFASVWNLRAYLEREYFRIDHLTTAMGVLLIPSTSNEQANGVAVSIDPVYKEPNAYYVNTQLGEELVTNPGALSIPEELLLYGEGTMDVVSQSSLVAPGKRLLSAANIAVLREALAVIHSRFAQLYAVKAGDSFAMEIEFKITSDGQLMIKQARQWLFDS